jgi:hypothetical protein
MPKIDLSDLAQKWPSTVVARTEVRNFSGGLINEKYLANLDSQGAGPGGRFKMGRKVGYSVNSLITWLESRMSRVDDDN